MLFARRFLWFKHGCPQSYNIVLIYNFLLVLWCFYFYFVNNLCRFGGYLWERRSIELAVRPKPLWKGTVEPYRWAICGRQPDLFFSLFAQEDSKLWPMSMKSLEAPLNLSRVSPASEFSYAQVLRFLSCSTQFRYVWLPRSLGYRRVVLALRTSSDGMQGGSIPFQPIFRVVSYHMMYRQFVLLIYDAAEWEIWQSSSLVS